MNYGTTGSATTSEEHTAFFLVVKVNFSLDVNIIPMICNSCILRKAQPTMIPWYFKCGQIVQPILVGSSQSPCTLHEPLESSQFSHCAGDGSSQLHSPTVCPGA